MSANTFIYIIPLAFLLDLMMGDSQRFPHPIRLMGHIITYMEPRFRKLPLRLMVSGFCFAGLLISTTFVLTWCLVALSGWVHPLLKDMVEVGLIYYCIAVKSLDQSAMAVVQALQGPGLKDARVKTGWIVGRDTNDLSESGVVRAAVETVAENSVDGVMAPLFFAALGGAPLAMAYKMVNTLDSMVGYKSDTYIHFGKAAARIDDLANYIPARISVAVIALSAWALSRRGKAAVLTAFREGADHSSPNAGFPEAAFAGALGVKLNGPNMYLGRLVDKPYIGKHFGGVGVHHVRRACDLMVFSALLWVVIPCGVAVMWQWLT